MRIRQLAPLAAAVPSFVALYLGATGAAGALAVAVSVVIFIPQAVRIWRLRRDAAALDGVSVTTYAMMVSNAIIWGAYGALLGEFWVAAPGLLNFPLAVSVLWTVARARSTRPADWMPLALVVVAVALWAVPGAGAGAVGALAAASSVTMFTPQAVRIWRMRRQPRALRSVSVPTYALMMADAVVWACYAWLLGEFWVAATGLVTFPLAVFVVALVWRERANRAMLLPG